MKILLQLSARERSNAINPPKTARMEIRGIMALIPSAAPLFEESVLSVNHALNAASFALEPKNVIRQSKIMTKETPIAADETAMGKSDSMISVRMNTKQRMEMPHKRYPPQMKSFRFPILSESAPMKTVVNVAATALAPTIREISEAEALNIL